MSKIEETIFKHDLEFIDPRIDIENALKEYANWYAQKVISQIKHSDNKIYNSELDLRSYIIDDNFKLPEHE